MPRHATGLGASGFPAANKLLMRYESDRAYKLHQQKIQNTRHRLDVKEPKRYNHLILRLKQIQKEEERQAEIDHENKVLLNKMTHVMKYGGNIDNWNNYESRSLNFPLREKQNEEIARQNISIARRLETVKPGLRINSWERDFQQHQYIRSMWNDSTKEFGDFSPRRYRSRMSHAVKRSMDNLDDTYDEDFQSETNEPDDKHLPKLGRHRKDPRKAKSETNAPTSPRKDEHRFGAGRQTRLPKIVPHRARSTCSTFRKSQEDKDKTQSDGKQKKNQEDTKNEDNTDDKKDIKKAKKSEKKKERNKDNKSNKEEPYIEQKENAVEAKSKGSYQSVNIMGNDLERVKTLISEEKDREKDNQEEESGPSNIDNGGESSRRSADNGAEKHEEDLSKQEQTQSTLDPDLFFDQTITESNIDDSARDNDIDNNTNNGNNTGDEPDQQAHSSNPDQDQNGHTNDNELEVENNDLNESKASKKGKRKKSQEDGVTSEKKKEDKEDKSDVAQLFKIAKQLGKPEDIFIKTLIKKSNKQRMATKSKFRQKYDLDLITELKNGLGSPWENLIDALLQERGVADAYSIFDALSTEDVIDVVELLATRSNTNISELKESYRKEFSISLEEDIADRTPRPVQALLIALQKGTRDESTEVDEDEATKDAEDLLNDGEGRWEQESGKFIQLLNVQSFTHMKAVFMKYKQVSEGTEILNAMKDDCDKSYFQALKVLVSCIVSPETYLASQLRKHKNATDPLFINILVLRSEIDMPAVRKVYKKTYGIDLTEEIRSKPHPTQKCLVELAMKGPAAKEKGGEGKKAGQPAGQQPQQPPKETGKKTQGKKSEARAKVDPETEAKKSEASPKSKPDEKPKQSKAKQDNPENQQDADNSAAGSKPKKGDNKPKGKTSNGTGNVAVANNGTIKATNNFRPDDDCDRLNSALTAEPVKDAEVVAIIPKRSNKQRQELKKVYEQKYKKNLMIDMDSEIPGDTEEITLALMMTPVEYDAYCVHEAVEGLGTSEPIMIAVLCTRPGPHVVAVKEAYKTTYKSDMVQDVTRDSSGDFTTLLTMLCQGNRDQGTAVDMNQADKDAKTLAEKFDYTSDLFKTLLTQRNHFQIKATFESYKKIAGQDICEALTNANIGDDSDAYICIAQAVEDPVAFHSEKLQKCFVNMGINDNLLIRMIVPRSEIDLIDIKSQFQEVEGRSLYQVVGDKVRGDYKDLLLAVIDNQDKQDKGKGKKTTKKASTEKQDKTTKPPTSTGGTVVPAKDFNAATDSERLNGAMSGFGTDEAVIVEILPKRSNGQRQELKTKYQELYKKDLEVELKSELRGDFEEVALALMMVPLEYDAYCLHEAVGGLGTNEGILIGILCTRTAKELTEIKTFYKSKYGRDLQLDLTQDTSGGLEDMIVELLKCERDQGTKADQQQAKLDAYKLYKDGQISIDPTDDTFRDILVKKNRAHVRATFEEYKKLAGNDIYEGIDKALMGDAEKGYKFLAKAIEDPIQFYAERLQDCFDGFGTNDTQLIRIVVSRSEIDLGTIKQRYSALYKKTLSASIENECSGDYKKMLLAVVGDNI